MQRYARNLIDERAKAPGSEDPGADTGEDRDGV